MPFEISRVVEATWDRRDQQSASWFAVLLLDRFGLVGDRVSDYLFGLSKQPAASSRFAARGVPVDASRLTRLLVTDNERIVATHGEGDFGHSHALLTELEHALRETGAPELSDSPWSEVFQAAHQLADAAPPIPVEQWRVIVWANW